jgi:hypothetical protein
MVRFLGGGARGVRCAGCRRTIFLGVWEGVVGCGANWADCPGFSLVTDGAGLEPGVRSPGFVLLAAG